MLVAITCLASIWKVTRGCRQAMASTNTSAIIPKDWAFSLRRLPDNSANGRLPHVVFV